MSKIINFIYNPDFLYTKVLDSLIDPILMHLPNAIKSSNFLEGQVNVNFFVETKIKRGIFISHGLADKNWRNADSVSEFDFIFVSGPLWKKKLINQGISENKIFINGFTKLDPAFQYKKMSIMIQKYTYYTPPHIIFQAIAILYPVTQD